MMFKIPCIVLLVFSVLLAGCGTSRRSETLGNAPELTGAEENGRLVFMQNCNACHVGGSGSLGPSLNDKPLPEFLMRFQVRHGLGVMPSFPEDKISEAELDDLMDYLKALRRGGESTDVGG
jgi:mono/diheme cytochrome c family protein